MPSPLKVFLIFLMLLLLGSSIAYLYDNLGCFDGTENRACSINQPLFCRHGVLSEKASLCGCPKGYEIRGESCTEILFCSDGTPKNKCSENKPLYCEKGELIEKASICGCKNEYEVSGEVCKRKPHCIDNTPYNECSKNKPLFCENGNLINKSTVCGCPENTIPNKENCVSRFNVGPDQRILEYTLRGKKSNIVYTVYHGLYEYLAEKPRTYYCNPTCPSRRNLTLRFLDEERQSRALSVLVSEIENITGDLDDRARIAVSLVQEIPYDSEALETGNLRNRYPYEVIYEMKGLCEEKSRLLAYLLRELGYGTALLNYETENHSAVGILCPKEYSQYSHGNQHYCFIEATTSSITTDNTGYYPGAGRLSTKPTIIEVSNGKTFNTVKEEYEDARKLIQLTKEAEKNQYRLYEPQYSEWINLTKKYNIKTTNETET